MPGIHFIAGHKSRGTEFDLTSNESIFCHNQRYQLEILHQDEFVQFGVSRYPEYPLTIIDDEGLLIVLEGRIYGIDPMRTKQDLRVLANLIFSDENNRTALSAWLRERDGDFIIAVYHKPTGRWAFVNDWLGRLPIYFYQQKGIFKLSREIGFLTRQSEILTPDRIALAQHLIFGFALGPRTLFEGIKRISPATILLWDSRRAELNETTLHQFNFDKKDDKYTADDNAERLSSEFITACRNRCSGVKQGVLSLSGGMDSRTVAAGLLKAGCRFKTVTFEDSTSDFTGDVVIARQLTQKLNLEWNHLELSKPTISDALRLIKMKGGLNSAGMAFYIPFLSEIQNRFGSDITFYSGDGGDKVLPDLRPPGRIGSSTRLIKYIINRNYVLHPKQVARLIKVSEDEIEADLRALIETYPEASYQNRYVHFMIYERAMKWLFEGEDRNRFFFWSCTPFYSIPFFETAMSVSDDQKQGRRLYRKFLERLSPEAAGIADNNFGVAITSSAYRRKLAILSFMSRFPGYSRPLKNWFNRPRAFSQDAPMVKYMHRQIENSQMIAEYFHISALMNLTARPEVVSETVMNNLFTIAKVLAKMEGLPDAPEFDAYADIG